MTLEEAIRFEERAAEAYSEAHNQFRDNDDPANAVGVVLPCEEES